MIACDSKVQRRFETASLRRVSEDGPTANDEALERRLHTAHRRDRAPRHEHGPDRVRLAHAHGDRALQLPRLQRRRKLRSPRLMRSPRLLWLLT